MALDFFVDQDLTHTNCNMLNTEIELWLSRPGNLPPSCACLPRGKVSHLMRSFWCLISLRTHMDFPLNLAIGGKSKETWRNAMYPILGPILFIKYISICLKSHVKYSIHQHISLSIWVVCVILWN